MSKFARFDPRPEEPRYALGRFKGWIIDKHLDGPVPSGSTPFNLILAFDKDFLGQAEAIHAHTGEPLDATFMGDGRTIRSEAYWFSEVTERKDRWKIEGLAALEQNLQVAQYEDGIQIIEEITDERLDEAYIGLPVYFDIVKSFNKKDADKPENQRRMYFQAANLVLDEEGEPLDPATLFSLTGGGDDDEDDDPVAAAAAASGFLGDDE